MSGTARDPRFQRVTPPDRSAALVRLGRPVESVWRALDWWWRSLNHEAFGKHWSKHGQGVPVFFGLEPHRSGALHAHALIGVTKSARLPAGVRRTWMWDRWTSVFGLGRSEFLPVCDGAVPYVAKYATKRSFYGASLGWDVMGMDIGSSPELPFGSTVERSSKP